jgi:N-acetylneuraminate synthase
MVKAIEITGRFVGPEHPCFVIAEAGVNHNGDLDTAHRLIDVAVRAGADAIKFQTFTAETLATPDAPKAGYQRQTTGEAESQFDMLRRLELSPQAHRELQRYCHDQKILFMSTPFDEGSADMLDGLGVPVFKVASGDLPNVPFLAHLARKGKPMIISTGMSWLGEVELALRTVHDAGNHDVALLHCVSNYPASAEDVNLRAMQTMATAFQVPVGFSDHTLGIEVALAAAALGACIIEKHFTLDRTLPGPDHRCSLQPDELVTLVDGIRKVELALGSGDKEPAASEADVASVARKSIVAAGDIPEGSTVTAEMLTLKRPGTGLPPRMSSFLIGRMARHDIPAGTMIALSMIL